MSDPSYDLMDFFDESEHITKPEHERKYQKALFGMPGGKFFSLPEVIPRLETLCTRDTVWVDHFGGTGVVTLNMPDTKLMVYNDRYSGVTDFYRCIHDRMLTAEVVSHLEIMPSLGREMWQRCAKDWKSEANLSRRAAMWYYMYRNSVIGKGTCFARAVNSKAPIQLPKVLERFWPVHYKFQHVQIENLDFEQCMDDYDSESAVHYLDPPYLNTDTGIYNHAWTEEDLRRLLLRARRCRGHVALSHYPCELIEAEQWDERHEWKVKVTADMKNQTHKGERYGIHEIEDAVEVLYMRHPKRNIR